MKIQFALSALALIFTLSSFGQKKYEEITGKPYQEGRDFIIKKGWSPIVIDSTEAHQPGGVALYGNGKVLWNMGFHEVESCSGTGVGYCQFSFENENGETLFVTTTGEQDPKGKHHAIIKEVWVEE